MRFSSLAALVALLLLSPVARANWPDAMVAVRSAKSASSFKPFVSRRLHAEDPAQVISLDITNVQELLLLTNDPANHDRNGAIWGNPVLIAKDGSRTPLASLKPAECRVGRRSLLINHNYDNKPLSLHKAKLETGLCVYGSSTLGYRLDGKYVRFEAIVGVDMHGKRGPVQFRVLDRPDTPVLRARMESQFPREMDWLLQDAGPDVFKFFQPATTTDLERKLIARVFDELGPAATPFQSRLAQLSSAPPTDPRWLQLYADACQARRQRRLQPLLAKWPAIVFTRHHNMGGSHYAYTEAQSDAQAERTFFPGSALCLLDVATGNVRTLIDDPNGVIRDPDVSYDGGRILFSWKKSDREDDYHLYELTLATGAVRQITHGLGYADIEPQYLPSGDILFNSTRPVQTVDCFTTEVSNLYACDVNGRCLRRLGFDQVHTTFPTVTDDGRVLYTRWEYNDRGQIYPQPLFQMNPDGTNQSEFYGNNSWFPTTILHARSIPGSKLVVAIASGHHSRQTGKLILIDVAKGQQENTGVQLIAPVRETPAERIDAYGQHGELFQYPYALNERHYLVTYTPHGWSRQPTLFGVYFFDLDGRRELLASDPKLSCNQPIPLAGRKMPVVRPSLVDYRKPTGTFYMQDVYAGQGFESIPRGVIKRLRVVALDYRIALVGGNNNAGPAGAAFIATPIAIGNGAWDVKIVLGDATVHPDGSAFFEVPARTPVYFQAIDEKGYMVQSMRSWTTLQPGENAACVGCHENKNTVPLSRPTKSYAFTSGPEKLAPFYGPPRGFSFAKEIQPILNKHCVECHDNRAAKPSTLRGTEAAIEGKPFSLLASETIDPAAKRKWSDAYLNLTASKWDDPGRKARGFPNPIVNWIHAQSTPPVQSVYSTGAARSGLMKMLEENHGGAKLSREELDKIACWIDLAVPFCGDYTEANAWSEADWAHHNRLLKKRQSQEELERKGTAEYLKR